MKSVSPILYVTITLFCVLPQHVSADTTITVTSSKELLAAIGSNRTIVLNADQFIMEQDQALIIKNIENLTLRGAGKEPVKIHEPNQFGDVIAISYSKNITLENMDIGHAPGEGYCDADVITLFTCQNITINNCLLFGSGQVGINAINLEGLTCNNCIIYDCSLHLVRMDGAENLNFNDCKFIDAQPVYSAISLFKTYTVNFKKCVFENIKITDGLMNFDGLFQGTDIQNVLLEKCTFVDNTANSLTCGPAADFFVLKNCKEQNNQFKK